MASMLAGSPASEEHEMSIKCLAAILKPGLLFFFGTAAATAAPAPPVEYVFFPVAAMPATFRWDGDDGSVRVGSFDAAGEFHLREKFTWGQAHAIGNHAPPTPTIRIDKPTRAYEFRSGRLILGTLGTDGKFVPEIGSNVVAFADYKHGEDPWIWNLPGYFIRKDKVDEHKDWLKERPGWPAAGWEVEYGFRLLEKRFVEIQAKEGK
jgi:hypothetical protein